jgi:anaphase-promoting complex subunit 6
LFFPVPQALSVDPINPHVLELLNTALESSVTKPHKVAHDAEWNQAVRTLKSKYTAWQDKGKERAHADVLPSNDIGTSTSAPDEMNIG